MNIEVRALSPLLLDDYVRYFDTVAFSDHGEWSACYCTHFHWDATFEAECKRSGGVKRGRDYAMEFIASGVLQGYLAYSDGAVVGWCNANDKTTYRNLVERRELWDERGSTERVKSVVCFIVAPGMRGKGIATQLLNRVCMDAAAEGFAWIEAYPAKGGNDCFLHHHGPGVMYERAGFSLYRDFVTDSIVRKRLHG